MTFSFEKGKRAVQTALFFVLTETVCSSHSAGAAFLG